MLIAQNDDRAGHCNPSNNNEKSNHKEDWNTALQYIWDIQRCFPSMPVNILSEKLNLLTVPLKYFNVSILMHGLFEQ